jgi:type VI protein secretion system component VasA
MTGSPEAFRQSLRAAFGPQVQSDGAAIEVASSAARIRLTIAGLAPASFGALQLERFSVEISPLEGAPEAVAALLERVDRATQRGGG